MSFLLVLIQESCTIPKVHVLFKTAVRLKQPFQYFNISLSPFVHTKFAFSTLLFFFVYASFNYFDFFLSQTPPPFLFHTLCLPRIEYIAIDQVSHRSQNSGFGSFYKTWLLNVDSDGSECDDQGNRTKLGHNKNGQHLFFQLAMYDIESWMSTSNNFSCMNNFPLYVCGERVNLLKTIVISFCMTFLSITDIDRQWHILNELSKNKIRSPDDMYLTSKD